MGRSDNLVEDAYGPGTRYVHGVQDLEESAAIVTEFVDGGVTSLGALISESLVVGPYLQLGSATIRTVENIWLGNGQSLKVKRFSNRRAGGGRKDLLYEAHYNIMSYPVWWTLTGENQKTLHTVYDPRTGTSIPRLRQQQITTWTLSWGKTTIGVPPPAFDTVFVDTRNRVNYFVPGSGITFPPGILRMHAPQTTHHQRGGFDQWDIRYSVTWHPFKWVESYLKAPATADDPPTLGERDIYPTATWPDLS